MHPRTILKPKQPGINKVPTGYTSLHSGYGTEVISRRLDLELGGNGEQLIQTKTSKHTPDCRDTGSSSKPL